MAALALGVAASQLVDFSFTETLLSVVLLGVLAWLGPRTGAPRAGLMACLAGFVVCGAMLGSRPKDIDPRRVDRVWIEGRDEVDDPVRLRGWVQRPPEFVGYGDRFVLEVESVFADSAAVGGVTVTVYREPGDPAPVLPYGTRVELLARLRTPRNFQNPDSFDYVGYLASRGIALTASARAGTPIHKLAGRGGSVWLSWVWGARQGAQGRLATMAAGRTSGLTGFCGRCCWVNARGSLSRHGKTFSEPAPIMLWSSRACMWARSPSRFSCCCGWRWSHQRFGP